MADFIPSREASYITWMTTFSTVVSADFAALGLQQADATALASLLTAFVNAYNLVADPSTRTPVTVTNKDVAKAALTADVRSLARRIQANPAVTAGQKTALGLPIHQTVPTPTPAPATKPVLAIADADTQTLTIRLADETTPTRRARPYPAIGAEVYSYVPSGSEEPPADLELWRFEGLATKSDFKVDFEQSDVGKKGIVRARWINRTGKPGPVSDAVSRTIAA